MKRALFALWLIGAILCTFNEASSQSLQAPSSKSQAEVHSVVVDQPQVISLPPAYPEAWETFWDSVPPAVQLDEKPPHQTALAVTEHDEIELLKVISTANIHGGPSASAEIIGIAGAGAEVQAALRDSGWVQIIDPWSCETGWIHSKFLAPLEMMPSAPKDTINAAANSARRA